MNNPILPEEISTVNNFVKTVSRFYEDSDRLISIHDKKNHIVFITVLDCKHVRCHLIEKNDEAFRNKIEVAFQEFAEEPYTDLDYRDFVKDFLWTF